MHAASSHALVEDIRLNNSNSSGVTFQVMYEPSFLSSVLLSEFERRFRNEPAYLGPIILGNPTDADVFAAKQELHRKLDGKQMLNEADIASAKRFYSDFSAMSLAHIVQAGFPPLAEDEANSIAWAAPSVMDERNATLIERIRERGARHYVFCFVDQIFRGTWLTEPIKLLNGHPGVLPYARGIGALEQIAATGDAQWFALAAGSSVHFINAFVDAGPIVRCQRLSAPFSFRSLAHLRAFNFSSMFKLMAEVASDLIRAHGVEPVGIPTIEARTYPCFLRRQRTEELRRTAEDRYLVMSSNRVT